MIDTQALLAKLWEAADHAEQIERANRDTGTPESKAYDAGRVSGMKDIIDIVRRELEK